MKSELLESVEKTIALASYTLVETHLISALLEYGVDPEEAGRQISSETETFAAGSINPAKHLQKDLWKFTQLASKCKKLRKAST